MRIIGRYGIYAAAVLSAMACVSCVKRPDKVLSDKDMAPVLADYELARAVERVNPDRGASLTDDEILMSVLDKHDVRREVYDSTIAWYGRNPDKYYDLCVLAEKELDRKKRRYVGKGSEVETNDMWPYGRMMAFSDLSSSDGMDFSITSSEVESGQRLRFKMRFSSRAEGSALMGVEYADGGSAYTSAKLSDRNLEINLQTDTARVVKRIFGNVMMDPATRLPLWADSISLAALPFDSLEYYKIHSQRRYYPSVRKTELQKKDDEVQDIVSDSAD